MISLTVTGYLRRKLGAYFRFYRLFYNVVALTTLLPVLLYSQMLKGPVIYRWQGSMTFVQILFLAVAVALLIAGSLKYDMHHFIGIRQIRSGKSPAAISKSGEIDTSGILNVTRHPWYLGAIVFLWVGYRELYVSTLVVNVLLTVYLIVGTVLEERKLIIEFGESYRNYMRRVSMLFPAKWLFSRLFAPVRGGIRGWGR
jgi:protein-S-isoprenylcysteine O-methyltransferase Ste14